MAAESICDLELGSNRRPSHLDGFPSFSRFIAEDRDAAIYRRFESLSARNLLYLQSELHEIEKQLGECDREDAKDLDDENAQQCAREWAHYSQCKDTLIQERRILRDRLKVKIKEYHEALLLESHVLAIGEPAPRNLKNFLRGFSYAWARYPPLKNQKSRLPALWGHDEQIFEKRGDLIALAPAETDRLNIFLKNYFGWFFQDRCHPESNAFYFPERRIQRAGIVLSTMFSAILLIGAVVCLMLISQQRRGLRIGMIALFTCLFAGVVGLLTNARRAEMFGSSAAYAAVLVVFVSSDVGTSKA